MPGKTAKGLTSAEASIRLAAYGPNTLPEKPPRSVLSILTAQLINPLILVLLGAATVTIVIGKIIDTSVILVAVGINTILGFIQEYKAETAIGALKRLLAPQARVFRDGVLGQIAVASLVPGDVVALSAGDRVAADGVLVEAVNLFINEAILTGESVPVAKRADGENDEYARLLMGTIVASGRATMRVIETGVRTKIGQLAVSLQETPSTATPLQMQLGRLAKILAILVIITCFGVFGLGVLAGRDIITMGTTSVAIAVSAVPEGMVVALTAILALGMSRIAKRKAIVRTLVATETLGSVTTVCVDKTGTITAGVMRVVKTDFVDSAQATLAAVLANNMSDPLEVALWDWASEHVDPQKITDEHPRTGEVPFGEVHKFMTVTTKEGVWMKGAPEVVWRKCTLTQKEKNIWEKKVALYASEGLRVLAFAHGLTFLGIIGIADPVREGVSDAVKELTAAGIAVKIVTGDYRGTAEAIAKTIGLPITDPSHQIIEGKELAAMTNQELSGRISDVVLFCRVTPMDKLKIVTVLQGRGDVVAMTGDGVNDAAAIKKADIGVVVSDASDVAKEIADVVLVDSNIRTIAAAVEEGRGIFENIRKVVLYLVSDSFVEILVIVASILLGLPLPLTALQILWINLVADGLPSLALVVDPLRSGLMHMRPRVKGTPIVDQPMGVVIALISISAVIFVIGGFYWALGRSGGNLVYAQTLVFTMVAVDSLIYVFSARRMHARLTFASIFHNHWLIVAVAIGVALQLFAVYHPWGNDAFGTMAIGSIEWLVIIGASFSMLGMIEGTKAYFFRRRL
ncbi:hypothetical protein A2875_01840 [Candidatus Gottesmanbacteria bacterium RIFCSPHIGHO2_01_FULL_46_14]|uniref:Cation-transporting P-type ATPase N-terminal domain-containing protein n=1 Tax=Candidatus Gottesmanbacteria bacterium RIFCSPHIGHO2_01_FULL_46_14 TaxID=1798380 RepID=A0A1F5ZIY1_9BACT|nr:MAG: hypothetical protein A2875_01840 [Candidatus Gottesmanbacteria bacterium RIFCSPHIGHO2_01_FULL_46_14]